MTLRPVLPTVDETVVAAFAMANLEACLAGSGAIEPIHILVCLLKIADGVFAHEARGVGLSAGTVAAVEAAGREARTAIGLSDEQLTALRRRLWAKLRSKRDPSTIRSLELSLAAQRLTTSASVLASEQGHRVLTLRHLFEILLREPLSALEIADVPPRSDDAPTGIGIRPAVSTPIEDLAAGLGRDLTALARAGRLAPVVGRRKELRMLARYLQRTSKRNVLILGEAGIGKTAVVEGLAQRLIDPAAPDFLRRMRIVQIEVADLVAGTAHRGDLEERLRALVDRASADPDLVLFIDEVHLVTGAGASRGALDVANILKPALARDSLRCIGATTVDEFERHIKPDAALLRRFQVLHIEEPSEADAIAMCQAWARRIEAAQAVIIEDEAIEASVMLSAQHISGRALPDKAIDLLENAAASTKISSLTFDARAPSKTPPRIGRSHVEGVLLDQYGISTQTGRAVDSDLIESGLRQELIGQDLAIGAIRATLDTARPRESTSPRPVGVLLFVGPTGVGKTFAAELLGALMFEPGTRHFIRFNMSELKEHHDLARLIGAPPGFIGHERAGALFEFTERHPQGVILLDEMEKAHHQIQDYFLQVFDKGEAIDSRGRKVSFRRYLFVLTCNEVPAREIAPIGFSSAGPPAGGPIVGAVEGLRTHFREEFLARMDNVVAFRSLHPSDYATLFARQWTRLADDLASRLGMRLQMREGAGDRLISLCMRGNDGVRGFVRRFERLLTAPIHSHVHRAEAASVSVDVVGDVVSFA
jgi:ATP-dependent Clp protease ATP-binding subunit ClpC